MEYELLANNALVNGVLSELNLERRLNVELCPEFVPGTSTSGESGLGYKLRRRGEDPARTLILILDQYTMDYRLAKQKMRSAILAFFQSENTNMRAIEKIVY